MSDAGTPEMERVAIIRHRRNDAGHVSYDVLVDPRVIGLAHKLSQGMDVVLADLVSFAVGHEDAPPAV